MMCKKRWFCYNEVKGRRLILGVTRDNIYTVLRGVSYGFKLHQQGGSDDHPRIRIPVIFTPHQSDVPSLITPILLTRLKYNDWRRLGEGGERGEKERLGKHLFLWYGCYDDVDESAPNWYRIIESEDSGVHGLWFTARSGVTDTQQRLPHSISSKQT